MAPPLAWVPHGPPAPLGLHPGMVYWEHWEPWGELAPVPPALPMNRSLGVRCLLLTGTGRPLIFDDG